MNMLDFELDENQVMIRDMVRRFAQEKLPSLSPSEVMPNLHALGLWFLTGAMDQGGSEMDWASCVLVLEELAKINPSVALQTLHFNLAMGLLPVANQSHDLSIAYGIHSSQQEQVFTLIASSTGNQSEHLLLPVSQDQFILVKASELGDTCTHQSTTGAWMGLKTLPLEELRLHDHTLDTSTVTSVTSYHEATQALGLAAVALGIGRASLKEALEYATTRKQFGKPLTAFQASQFKIANMATQLDAASVLIWQAASMLSHTPDAANDMATLAYNQAVDASIYAADEGLQLHGGYGYTQEYPIERLYREVHALALLGKRQQRLLALADRMIDADNKDTP